MGIGRRSKVDISPKVPSKDHKLDCRNRIVGAGDANANALAQEASHECVHIIGAPHINVKYSHFNLWDDVFIQRRVPTREESCNKRHQPHETFLYI